MYFGVACATLHQNCLVQFFAIELISHIYIYKLAITNSEQSRICLLLCAQVYLRFYLSMACIIIYFIYNHCRDNQDTRDEALGLKY